MEVNSSFAWKKEKTRHNSPLLPDNIRGLIVGSSNCGKTTLILNLLLNPGWLDYNRLYVFGKSLHQKEYQILRKGFEAGLSKEQLSNFFKNQDSIKSPIEALDEYISSGGETKGGIQAEFFDDCKKIPDPGVLNDREKNLMIFDDCILEKQSKAQSYYTRGRHSSCDSFYISQNYFKLDRQTIRENSNLIILFPQNPRSLAHIHSDHCGEISFQEFKDFCNRVWSQKYNFVTLDLTNTERKYRQNFDQFFNPKMSLDDKSYREYSKLVERIKERNENEKTRGFYRQADLNEKFRPLIQATQEQTAQLKSSLEPPKKLWDGSNALDFYFHQYPRESLDVNYGIRIEGEKLVIGDEPVRVEGNKIIVNDKEYQSTPKLWALIMQKSPDMTQIDEDTLREYKRLITDAGVEEYVEENYAGASYRQLRKTKILADLEKNGTGISFLPSDIDSLHKSLRLLLGEFKAGNRATQNEIVAIVDNLLDRKRISRTEAREINKFLQNAGD